MKPIKVPHRGDNGPDIIDMVYKVEMENGKIAFLIIECKFNYSKLGWVDYKGKAVQQFSPEWFELRIEEIKLQNPDLALELYSKWKSGDILPYVFKINPDGTPINHKDFSKEWLKYKRN